MNYILFFFSYFEKTYFTCKNKRYKEVSLFHFSLWSYNDKLGTNGIIDHEENFSTKDPKLTFRHTNNFRTSLNSYINNFIPNNQNIKVKLFIEVIQNLFKRNTNERRKNELLKDKKISS